MKCLNIDTYDSPPQIVSNTEQIQLSATANQYGSIWHLSQALIRLEAGLKHISKMTILTILQGQNIEVNVEKYNIIFDEDDKQCQVVSR